jgi:hypothetical protein
LLRRLPAAPETRKDVVPVDYVAEVLVRLLFLPGLRHRRYHVSAGEGAAVSWREMDEAFGVATGKWDGPCQVVDHATLVRERGRLAGRLGPGDEGHFLSALRLYFQFSTCGAEVFDNCRIREEGVAAPPPFTRYLARCVQMPADRGVYEQMRDDE